ncbi:immunoglobulin lambda-1 light chain-like isoform X2 [Hemicordylus capensis]|uniref:immunoglobulin lambda-1 light chain-like isoform X2 n=1 Tax=Hemicordylus capensis TaxID=884348 RepID=UPI002304236D|nr:immunoglobulin lambda-1 light chain-like isoform X2 [Hemicordylus capensis]
MRFHFLGILLLFLHTPKSQGNTKIPQQLTQVWASPGETRNITCDLPYGAEAWNTAWYKEEQDRSLHMIEQSYEERTAGEKVRKAILTLRNIQRKHSGIYYCATINNETFRILKGTRLIIRGIPSLSILAPSSLEGAPFNHSIPLFCLVFDAHPDWDEIAWNINGETSWDQKDANMVDGEGVFSIWSLKLMPPEFWTEGMSYSCSDQENRKISAVVPTNTVPTDTATVFIFRKHLTKGNGEKTDTRIPMAETPQTDYAELRCRN